MSIEFNARVLLLIEELVDSARNLEKRNFWKRLEEITGINARTWRSIHEQRQRATTEVLAALGKLRPQYAFWLMTGITDVANGHIAPVTATTLPERAHMGDPLAERYFQASIEFKDRVLSESTDTLENSIKALARTIVFARWWDSVLVDKIYAECSSEQYQELKEIWQKREETRSNHLARLSKEKSNNPHGDEVPVPDPRTAHQHQFFMFYEPRHDDTKD